ncbi:RWD-domain-containing protein [Peniophora sp. CONT]|nr:RWD-domain-containing protein [Peniophora sp. CONT]
MSTEVLQEEFEVLESIYPDELTKLSERHIKIDVEPEELEHGVEPIRLSLNVDYPEEYPDVLPDLTLEHEEDVLDEAETEKLLSGMKTVGEENLGMAMTFTMVTYLREELTALVGERAERIKREEAEKERLALEAEEARTRGTPVTRESFLEWKTRFDKETAIRKTREDEDRLKALSPKEREECKRIAHRPTGRQLFEKNKSLDVEDSMLEDGAVSVDLSQYDRSARSDADEEEDRDRVDFSDSD